MSISDTSKAVNNYRNIQLSGCCSVISFHLRGHGGQAGLSFGRRADIAFRFGDFLRSVEDHALRAKAAPVPLLVRSTLGASNAVITEPSAAACPRRDGLRDDGASRPPRPAERRPR